MAQTINIITELTTAASDMIPDKNKNLRIKSFPKSELDPTDNTTAKICATLLQC